MRRKFPTFHSWNRRKDRNRRNTPNRVFHIISKKTSSTEETAQLIKLNSKSDARRIIDLYDKRFNSYTSMTYYQDDEYVIYGSANIVKYFK